MDLLNNLNGIFRLAVAEDASSEAEIADLIGFSQITVPDEYLNLIRKHTELEFAVSEVRYLRVWGASGCIEMNEAYNIQKYIPQSLAIGDDEGGNALIYATGANGFGLYAAAWNDLEVEEMKYISDSLTSLLVSGKGVRALIE